MNISLEQLQQILEAALMVAGRPLPIANMQRLFEENEQPTTAEIQAALAALRERYESSGIELREIASGFQFQARMTLSPWLSKLWEERPARYSRALLETLALIAYRQPITRAEIEEIRSVTVSSHITKALLEREWIRVIGYREVVGKPALYGTTKAFLDHFNLKSLDELPTLAALRDLETQEAKLQVQLELTDADASEMQIQSHDENGALSSSLEELEVSQDVEAILTSLEEKLEAPQDEEALSPSYEELEASQDETPSIDIKETDTTS